MILSAELTDIIHVAQNLRDEDVREVAAMETDCDRVELAQRLYGHTGVRYACFNRVNEPVIIFGLAIQRPCEALGWAITSKKARHRDWLEAHKFIKKLFQKVFEQPAIHRIEVMSIGFRKQAHPWFMKVGFKREGVMKSKGMNGEDLHVFGITRGGI